MSKTMTDEVYKSATLSPCGRYRGVLIRTWDASLPVLSWCMLNPSTADGEADDPTIRKCIGFAKRYGYGGIRVVNLYDYRATQPSELKRASDTVTVRNELLLKHETHNDMIVGWGGSVPKNSTTDALIMMLRWARRLRSDRNTWCLGKTKGGEPRHPLMLAYSTPLEDWL